MLPLMNQTHQSQNSSSRITIRTAAKLLAICLIAAAVPLALYVRVKSEDSTWFSKAENSVTRTKRAKEHVTVQAAGRGKPFLNLQDGREMSVTYRGDDAAVAALQSGAAQARALASADFDRNGTPDVVAGYALQWRRNNHRSARKPGCVRSHERLGFCAYATGIQPRIVVGGRGCLFRPCFA